MKLWEVEHSYYCAEEEYHAGTEAQCSYRSWADFMAEEGDADEDYNLLFRWDWRAHSEDGDEYEPGPDPYYRNGRLQLCWMVQRKGYYRCSLVEVCAADEPKVREWLKARWLHLAALWAPISDAVREDKPTEKAV